MILHKYLAPDRVDVIENRSIRFTPASCFNDPYESEFAVTALASEEWMIEQWRLHRTRLFREELQKRPGLQQRFTVDQLQQLIDALGPSLIAGFKTDSENIGKELRVQLAARYSANIGVLSLSERHDELLMWAHYALNHTGVVVGFDTDHTWFDNHRPEDPALDHPLHVRYSQTRPSGPFRDLTHEELFLTKGEHWSYEREWRMLKLLEEATQVIGSGPQAVHLFSFPADCVRSVIVGCRASVGTRERAIRAAAGLPQSPAVWHARVDATEYKLIFEHIGGSKTSL